jgi:hypothetical protein
MSAVERALIRDSAGRPRLALALPRQSVKLVEISPAP